MTFDRAREDADLRARRHEWVGRRRLFANERAVLPRVETNRMRKNRWGPRRTVDDVVGRRSTRRIQTESIADSLGDLMIGARRVTADAEPVGHLAEGRGRNRLTANGLQVGWEAGIRSRSRRACKSRRDARTLPSGHERA